MTSGVYKLTFSSGNTYIGKSINIENRWKQHFDKFASGKAASNMQAEFNKSGYPNCEIVFRCHPDHIDVVESCYINRFKPTLNGTYPDDPFADLNDEDYEKVLKLLHMSTTEHIFKLYKFKEAQDEHIDEILELRELNDMLLVKRSDEELKYDVSKRIKSQKIQLDKQEHTIESLKNTNMLLNMQLNYHKRPWWQKLF